MPLKLGKLKVKNKKIFLGEKLASTTSSLSGGLSFLGGYQVCHNVCLGIIALLSLIGITLAGMPLFFLTKVAVPFWIAAVILLFISLLLYLKKKCISKNILLINLGIIIIGVPFAQLQNYIAFFWLMGGALIFLSMLFIIRERMVKKAIKEYTAKKRKLY